MVTLVESVYQFQRNTHTPLLLLVFLLIISSASAQKDSPAPGVTYANYQRLKLGMHYEEVCKILGGPGEEVERRSYPRPYIGHNKFIIYKWTGAAEHTGILAQFANGKLQDKAQKGLN